MRDSVTNDHSGLSFHGWSLVPGEGVAPGGSGSNNPEVIRTPTHEFSAFPEMRYLSRKGSHRQWIRARLRVIANAERDGGDVSVKRYIGMERRPEDVDVRALRDGDVDIGATTKEAHVYCERNAHFDAGIEIVMKGIPLNENVAVYCEPCANAANACGSL